MEKAIKHDQGKPPLNLLARSFLNGVSKVLGFGARKYGRDNWRKGMEWSRVYAAAMRHLTAWNEGENYDAETGLSHLYHAACCLMFLVEYQEKGVGTDDRYKGGRPTCGSPTYGSPGPLIKDPERQGCGRHDGTADNSQMLGQTG